MAQVDVITIQDASTALNAFIIVDGIVVNLKDGKKYTLVSGQLNQTVSETLTQLVSDAILNEISA